MHLGALLVDCQKLKYTFRIVDFVNQQVTTNYFVSSKRIPKLNTHSVDYTIICLAFK